MQCEAFSYESDRKASTTVGLKLSIQLSSAKGRFGGGARKIFREGEF